MAPASRLGRPSYSRQHVDRMLAHLGTRRPIELLEVGAADGELTTQLQEREVSALALDLEMAGLRQLSFRARSRAVAASVEALPLASSSFDAVALFDVLEHVPSPYAALCEIHRVLKTRGWLFLSTPNLHGLDRFIHPDGWSGVADPDHKYLWSSGSLRHTLQRTGFAVKEVVTPVYGLPRVIAPLLEAVHLGGQLWLAAQPLTSGPPPSQP